MWVEETTSTQDAVRSWAMAQRPAGMSLVAERQTEGRGRLGRTWESPAGASIQLSVLLRPAVSPARLPLVSLATAVAVRQATRGRLGIKWPNDLLGADRRKVAGIIAEADIRGKSVSWIVVGVGLNVSAIPPGLPGAGYLEQHGPPIDREELAVDLVALICAWAKRVEVDPEGVLRHWRRGACMIGERVRVDGREGLAVDVDGDGALILQADNGDVVRVLAGDVEMIG